MARTLSTTGVTASVREYMKDNAGTELTSPEIAEALGLETQQVSSALQSLHKQEQVRNVRRGVWMARQRRRSTKGKRHHSRSSHTTLVIGKDSQDRLFIEHDGQLYVCTPVEA